MNKLPKEQILIDLLQQAKEAEQKAKELEQMGKNFSQKWESRLKERNKSIQQQ
jgi:hypothetical protein